MEKLNVAENFDLFSEYWNPKIAAELNDSYIKLAKLKAEFVWHHHEKEDELFFVMKGCLVIKLREGEVRIGPGEFVVIPPVSITCRWPKMRFTSSRSSRRRP